MGDEVPVEEELPGEEEDAAQTAQEDLLLVDVEPHELDGLEGDADVLEALDPFAPSLADGAAEDHEAPDLEDPLAMLAEAALEQQLPEDEDAPAPADALATSAAMSMAGDFEEAAELANPVATLAADSLDGGVREDADALDPLADSAASNLPRGAEGAEPLAPSLLDGAAEEDESPGVEDALAMLAATDEVEHGPEDADSLTPADPLVALAAMSLEETELPAEVEEACDAEADDLDVDDGLEDLPEVEEELDAEDVAAQHYGEGGGEEEVQEDPDEEVEAEPEMEQVNVLEALANITEVQMEAKRLEFEEVEDYYTAKRRLTEIVNAQGKQTEVERFLSLMRAKGGGNITLAWRRYFDSDGDGELSFTEFSHALATLNYRGDVIHLWHALAGQDEKALSLEVLDPEGAAVLDTFGRWCHQTLGGPFEVFQRLDDDGSDSLTNSEFVDGLEELGFLELEGLPASLKSREGLLQNLFPLLDQGGNGAVSAEEFMFLEKDREKRKRIQAQLDRVRNFGHIGAPEPLKKEAQNLLWTISKNSTLQGGRHWKMLGEPKRTETLYGRRFRGRDRYSRGSLSSASSMFPRSASTPGARQSAPSSRGTSHPTSAGFQAEGLDGTKVQVFKSRTGSAGQRTVLRPPMMQGTMQGTRRLSRGSSSGFLPEHLAVPA